MRRFCFGTVAVPVFLVCLAVSSSAQVVKLEASLRDASYESDQQWGQATLLVDGTRVVYDISLFFAGDIASAVVTRSNDTAPTIDLRGSSPDNRAFGVDTVGAPQASALTADPTSFVLRVSGTEGDLIGALRYAGNANSAPTAAYLPLVAHNNGQAGSIWRTDLHLVSLAGEDVEVVLDYFPMSAGGNTVPPATRMVIVGGGGQLVLRDVLGTLFGRDNDRGALRLSAARGFGARARIYNAASGDGGAGSGNLSLYARAFGLSEVPTAGALLGLSNRGGASGDGFRTNVITFNPTEAPITVTLTAVLDDGSLLGTQNLTVGPYANDVTPVFAVIDAVREQNVEQGSFLLKYVASGPLIVQAAEIDGAVGDGVLIDPVAIGGTSPQPPSVALAGTWLDSLTLVGQNQVNVCGVSVSWDEMDVEGERRFLISQEGSRVTLCNTLFSGACYEGSVQGNRLVATYIRSSARSTWCTQYALFSEVEATIDVTVESNNVMRGTETLKVTYFAESHPPIEHVATISLVMVKE